MRLRLLRSVLLIATCTCGSHAIPVEYRPANPVATILAPVARTPRAVEINVSEDPRADRWMVTYQFAKPVTGVTFERSHDQFRKTRWSAVADGRALEWSVVNQREALASNVPFQKLALSFATDVTNKPSSDYLLNVAFTDGARLFYTGHFAIQMLDASGREATLPAEYTRWTFHTPAGRSILVFDQHQQSELVWEPKSISLADGTYAYFGNAVPVETPVVRLVIDPGMPPWMIESANKHLPPMLDWFASDTHAPLDVKPLLFLSYGGKAEPGRSNKGGALPAGVVQLAVSGAGWSNDSDADVRIGWLEFLGHEMFHLWNGQMFRTRGGGDEAWLSEGSSDLFAKRALLALGVIDQARYRHEVLREANRCLIELRQDKVIGTRGIVAYVCGATILAWADAVARDHGSTVGHMLGEAFADAAKRDRLYDTDGVLAIVARVSQSTTATEPFERVLRHGVTDRADELFARELTGKSASSSRDAIAIIA